MSPGWGLRGFIGGGPLGAMLRGSITGLVLLLLLGLERETFSIPACEAAGAGFGGQMTYGQMVGLSFHPATYWWAVSGFAVKGGVWGLLGGTVLGAGLLRAQAVLSGRRFLAGCAFFVAAVWMGWRLVNHAKLVYFSNPTDQPREEVWAGLLLGALVLLGWSAFVVSFLKTAVPGADGRPASLLTQVAFFLMSAVCTVWVLHGDAQPQAVAQPQGA